MANETRAVIDCDLKIVGGEIRVKSKGRYKYYLYTEKFGPQFFNTQEGQDFLLANMREIGEPKPGPVAATKPAPVVEPKPAPVVEPEKKKSFFDIDL